MPDGNINPVWIHLLVVFHFCVNYLLTRIPWIQDVELQELQLNACDSRLVCCTYLWSCLAGLWPERWPCLTWTWTGNLWDQQNVIFFSQWPGWYYSCGSVWLNVSVFVYAYSNRSSSEIHFVWSNCETLTLCFEILLWFIASIKEAAPTLFSVACILRVASVML